MEWSLNLYRKDRTKEKEVNIRRLSMEHCAACGTPEQQKKLKAVIESSRSTPGCLMHILQEAQAIYGFLPIEVQKIIAEGLGISLSEVYGVVTFYSQFSLKPKGKYRISVCLGTACYVKGSDKILEEIEKQLGINAPRTGCSRSTAAVAWARAGLLPCLW